MVRVIQLISSIDVGGAENVAFSISEYCDKKDGIEIIIVELFGGKGNYAKEKRLFLINKGIKVVTLSFLSKRISLFFAPLMLIFSICKYKPSIIHSHTDLPDFVLAIAIRILKIFGQFKFSIIRTIHNTRLWPTHNQIGKFVERSFQKDTVIGVSDSALLAYYSLRSSYALSSTSNSCVIHNGCNVPTIEELPFEIDNSKVNILYCGRFEYQKGVDLLCEILSSNNDIFVNDVNFYFIGSGMYEKQIRLLNKKYDNIHIYNPIVNIANKLWNFDYLIMPSRHEGLVLLSIEASYSKLPVIATRVDGLRETLPEDWPLFFNLDDDKSLIDIINRILSGEVKRSELQDRAYNFVKANFSNTRMCKSYKEIYLNLDNNN